MFFTAEFNRRLAGMPLIRTHAIDPGLVNTEIGSKNNHGMVRWNRDLRRRQGADPSIPARTIAMDVSRSKLDPLDGIYRWDCRSIAPSRYALHADEVKKYGRYPSN